MLFSALPLAGAFLIEPHRIKDDRGFFARVWCAREAEKNGLSIRVAQCSTSHNTRRGTLRGMHYQVAPYQEAKLVRCTAGAIYDVILDLRKESGTYLRWFAVELSASNRLMLYIPEGCAHGFQTLTDDAEVFYQISEFYEPTASRGVRWDDAAFGIRWPVDSPILSRRDASYTDFTP
jgi:dTDP-4-dehydrorhamnose 3,5-epimerase